MSDPFVVEGRFTGGALFAPKVNPQNGQEKYTLNLVLNDGEEKKVESAIKAAIQEKWGGKTPAGMMQWALRKGDDPEYASFDKYYINAKANTVSAKGVPLKRPGTFIKRDGVLHTVEATDDIIYPGCFVAVEVNVYCYNEDKAKNMKAGVSIGFNKVLFRKHGERLTSQTNAADTFSGLDSEEEAADTSDLGF